MAHNSGPVFEILGGQKGTICVNMLNQACIENGLLRALNEQAPEVELRREWLLTNKLTWAQAAGEHLELYESVLATE